MKNIRILDAPKYSGKAYRKTAIEGVYTTRLIPLQEDGNLFLQEVTEQALADRLRAMDGWTKGETELVEDMLVITYDGQVYYRTLPEDGDMVLEIEQQEPEKVYVCSLAFEQEPEFGEGSDSSDLSQYPLEDILDEFGCWISDAYDELNAQKSATCVLEFASSNRNNTKRLLELVGKTARVEEVDGRCSLKISDEFEPEKDAE